MFISELLPLIAIVISIDIFMVMAIVYSVDRALDTIEYFIEKWYNTKVRRFDDEENQRPN